MEEANDFIIGAAVAGAATILFEYIRSGGHMNWERVSRRARQNAVIVGTVALLVRQPKSRERSRRHRDDRDIRL